MECKVLEVVSVEVELVFLELGDVVVDVRVVGGGEDLREEDQHIEVVD